MPRKPRFFLPNVPVHIVIRGNSRKAIFAETADYQVYLDWLKEGSEAHDCKIHAYVLMTNHVHLMVSAKDPLNLSKLPQYIGRKYVPFFNTKYDGSGILWEGRFKASSIDSENYLFYLNLDVDTAQRLRRYRESVIKLVDQEVLRKIRASVQTGTPLGNQKFKDEMGAALLERH
jgi:putative transposase